MPQSPGCPRCASQHTATLTYDPRSQLPIYRCRDCGHLSSPFDPALALRLLRTVAPELLRSACAEVSAAY